MIELLRIDELGFYTHRFIRRLGAGSALISTAPDTGLAVAVRFFVVAIDPACQRSGRTGRCARGRFEGLMR
jgi:hypothetical protein